MDETLYLYTNVQGAALARQGVKCIGESRESEIVCETESLYDFIVPSPNLEG